jgi:hypothetical protein
VPSSDGRVDQHDLSWLTFEVAGYMGLLLLALSARLFLLDLWPLSEAELPVALSALRAARGEAWRARSYSPLLFDFDLLLFALTRATEGAARLVSVLAGTVLVGTPYLFRRRLGRWGALAGASLMAASPLGLYLSRSGDGTVLALLFVVLALASLEHDRPGLLVMSVALGVLTAPGFYTLPIGIGIALLIMRLVGRSHPAAARLRGVLGGVSARHLVAAGVVLALGATAGTANLAGVAATAELAWRWLASLVPSTDAPAWWWTIANLGFYEPITLALALAAVVYAFGRSGEAWERAMVVWMAWSLALGTVGGHRAPIWLAEVWLPAVVLAARGVERLAAVALEREHDGRDMAAAFVIWAVLCFAWLQLTAYQYTAQRVRLSLMIWGMGAGVVLLWGYGLWRGTRRALHVAACGIALVGIMVQVSNASALAYRTARDPRELLVGRTVSVELRTLEGLVAREAALQGMDRTTLRIVYHRDLDIVLGWALRSYPLGRASEDPLAEADADVWITPELPEDHWPARLVGQRVALWETLDEGTLSHLDPLRWLVTRASVGRTATEAVHVWVRADSDVGAP